MPKTDVLGAGRDSGQHHLRGRDRELRAVVLPHPEEVHTDRVGQLCLRDDVADRLRAGEELSVRVPGDVAERVQPEFDAHVIPSYSDE